MDTSRFPGIFRFIIVLCIVGLLSGCGGSGGSGGSNNSAIIPETTKVLSGGTTDNLSSVSPDGTTLVFSQGSTELAELEPGDIVVSDVNENAPDGFLREIISVTSDGNEVVVQTGPATLEDAIQEGSINFHQQLTPSGAMTLSALSGVNPSCAIGDVSFNLSLNNVVLYDDDGDSKTTDDQLVANGSLSFTNSIDFNVAIKNHEITNLNFINTVDETADLQLSVELGAVGIKGEKEIAKYTLGPYVVWVGYVPVVLTPVISVKVGFNGEVTIVATTGVTQSASYSAGITYEDGSWSPINDYNNSFTYTAPTINNECSLRAYAGPSLNLYIYGVAGPYGEMDGSLKLEADLSDSLDSLWWGLYGGLDVKLGVRGELLSDVISFDYYATIIDYQELLYEETLSLGGGHTISGKVTLNGAGLAGVTVTLSGTGSSSTVTDSNGAYAFSNAENGSYTLTPSLAGYSFTPSSIAVTVHDEDVLVGDIVATDDIEPASTFYKTFGGSNNDVAFTLQMPNDEECILAGVTCESGISNGDVWLIKTDASGNILWENEFGGDNDDVAFALQQTSDGGYILAGYTYSFGAGGEDAWLIKTDANGNVVWDKTFGGSLNDVANTVQQTNDGGYILAGYTTSFGSGGADAWLIKTDANGNMLWDKTYGGSNGDSAFDIQKAGDGGYVLTGYTFSFGAGSADVWLIKTDANGNILWDKTCGGSSEDLAVSIQRVTDGGYVMTGYTCSFGAGNRDVWLIKTDANGNILWDKTYGGSSEDMANAVQQTSDGGYILAGYTYSFGAGGEDAWLIKTDANGNVVWDKTFGGSSHDMANDIQQISNGGYIFAGKTSSYGAGGNDFWLIKTDANGNVPATPAP